MISRPVLILTISVASLLLTAALPAGEAGGSGSTIIFSTDFEGVGFFIREWEPLGWSRGDQAEGHEDDLWCRLNPAGLEALSATTGLDMRARSPGSVLYSARLGTNSVNGASNLVNGYPDPGMDAYVRYAPPNAARYDGMTLSFWYWARTHDAGYTGELTDYLCVNLNDGSRTSEAWRQPAADSGGWQQVVIELPAGTIWMEWEYRTSKDTVGHYPGVMIDDVTVLTESGPVMAPYSMIGGMREFYGQRDVYVPITLGNAGQVSLHYRAGDGDWTRYVDDDHPDGMFIPPITFRAPGDGRYELFSIAESSIGAESTKSAADASFVVDTIAPKVGIAAPAQGAVIGTGPSSLEWTASDEGSGIERTELSLNGGPWTAVNATSQVLEALAPGLSSASIRARDLAGGSAEASVHFIVDPTAPPMVVSPIGGGAFLDQKISASFQGPVDRGSVSLVVDGTTGEMAWDGDTLMFTPSSPLGPERTYRAVVSGLAGDGSAFAVNWSFTTVRDAGGVSGFVVGADGRAAADAKVTLSNGAVAVTDPRGYFEFDDVAPGEYDLTISGDGYETITRSVIIRAGQTEEMGVFRLDDARGGAARSYALFAVLVAALAGPGAVVAIMLRRRR